MRGGFEVGDEQQCGDLVSLLTRKAMKPLLILVQWPVVGFFVDLYVGLLVHVWGSEEAGDEHRNQHHLKEDKKTKDDSEGEINVVKDDRISEFTLPIKNNSVGNMRTMGW